MENYEYSLGDVFLAQNQFHNSDGVSEIQKQNKEEAKNKIKIE